MELELLHVMKESDVRNIATDLLNSCWREVGSRTAYPTGDRIEMPEMLPADSGQPSGANFDGPFPVLDYYDAALHAARKTGFRDIVSAMEALRGALRWSRNAGYRPGNVPEELLNGYAYAGLAGPGGLIPSASPLCGFMLMAPGITYPDHRHAPPEIYLVLTPGTEWRLDRKDWFDIKPGDLVHHTARQWHATRTRAEPMLAFAGWLEPGQRADIAMECN
jgi:mannose-6-phosphate isomerase-like protein (cupin superfamily)